MSSGLSNIAYTHSMTSFTSGMITSGIPTRTTHTLTPTTLRNIQESFMDLQSLPPSEHQHQAGFVPPVVSMSALDQNSDSNGSYNSDSSSKQDEAQWLPSCMQSTSAAASSSGSTSSGKSRSGGRRSSKQERLSPEEEERRRVRRERNKLAAARCRKRRMDHTNCLLVETEGLEEKRHSLQNEIQVLTHQKEELEFLLEAHRSNCKRNNNNRGNANSGKIQQQNSVPFSMANSNAPSTSDSSCINNESKVIVRPTTLPLSNSYNNIPIKKEPSFSSLNTPSTNFDWLMEGGTGFTPLGSGLTPLVSGLTPLISCSGQQRSSSSDLSSPDTINPPKLVSL